MHYTGPFLLKPNRHMLVHFYGHIVRMLCEADWF